MSTTLNETAKNDALHPRPVKGLSKSAINSLSFATPDDVQDLVCFTHLRWDFVYQRPQHLLSRASRQWRVWYIEEPVWCETLRLEVRSVNDRIRVVVPHLPHGLDGETTLRLHRQLIDQFIEREQLNDFSAWYYTPMALPFSDHLQPRLTVYDCMDHLAAFADAPPHLLAQEETLMRKADLVYTGGYSLYEAKQKLHPQAFAFPSCIDLEHFMPGRGDMPDPHDQQAIGGPRIGFSGVIDERIDLQLLGQLAQRRPEWQFIMLGPVVKIDHATLPQAANIHYLGMKSYRDLPAYFSNWQVAMMPFALNEATRYISPTKTPEYLAAGLPVVSTPIRDVVRSYGGWGPVLIGDTVPAFEKAIELALNASYESDWAGVDAVLKAQSWDNTWQQMQGLIEAQLQEITLNQ